MTTTGPADRTAETTARCPRDGSPMVVYSRAGVQVDQCEICKGVFLDRGELEQLIQAEQNYYQQPTYQQPGYAQPGYQQGGYAQPGYQQQGYPRSGYYDSPHYDEHHGGHHYEGHHGGHHGRRGFLHELFD